MQHVEYHSNNSGGSWWLDKQDWENLEKAGWEVEWDEWLGAPARRATRTGLTEEEAVEEWERVTGQDSNAIGCTCCGQPHNFYSYEEEEEDDENKN
jgi:hypothetical protein